ncbi:LacI family DNA-binding transcriptional regulator [soil metagenome]
MAKVRTTISDVAREAGVSKGLVSFALNDRPGVAQETRERILDVADRLGWRPNLRARSLSTNRAFAIGLVIARDPGIIAGDPFFPAFIAGVESTLAPAGMSLVLSMVVDEAAETQSYRQLAENDRVDGVILTDLRHDDSRVRLVAELGLRAVTLGRPDAASPLPAVSLDDGPGIRAAVIHLAELGHRRIAHVAGPSRMLHGTRRRDSFAAELAQLGLADDLIVETDFTAADGARATRELLARTDRPTAIVYANDPMAIAGIGVAQRLGFRVPDDLSVTGFDGSDVGEYLHPALTTVTTAVSEWGGEAARTLLQLIDQDAASDVDLAPARLVVRESTSHPSPTGGTVAADRKEEP